MARIFLSHASKDSNIALKVRGWLADDGHEVFLDFDERQGIPTGEAWKEYIYDRLRWADSFVCIVTRSYNQSQWCFGEIVAARVAGCPVIPLASRPRVTHPLLQEIQHVPIYGSDPNEGRARLLEWVRLCEQPGAAGWPDDLSPFPGLRPFEPEMHAAFFGRASETETIVRRLRTTVERNERHMLIVVGPSGCGKSSLVRAGVYPAIAREHGWTALPPISPGEQPTRALASAFSAAMPVTDQWSPSVVHDRIVSSGLDPVIQDFLVTRRPTATKLLLVIDQFEELLTQVDEDSRTTFARILAPSVAGGTIHPIATMRSEFLDFLLGDPDFANFSIKALPLRPLESKMLRQVVEPPLRLAGIRADGGLVDKIVADTGTGECLPLLAYTLYQLAHDLPRGAELTTQAYEASGGVQGTLVREADSACEAAAAASSRSTAEVLRTLLRMVAVDETGHASRLEADYDLFDSSSKVEIGTFVARRILVVRADSEIGGNRRKSVVSFAHETVLREWPPLAEAIAFHADALKARSVIEGAAATWIGAGRRSSYLWSAGRLSNGMMTLRATFGGAGRLSRFMSSALSRDINSPIIDLTPSAKGFLSASARRNRRRRVFQSVAVTLVIVASCLLTGVALNQRSTAIDQQRLASARLLVARAEQLREGDIWQALKLNLAADRLASTPDTRASLAATLAGTPLVATLPMRQAVTSVALSPDSDLMVSAGNDDSGHGAVEVWDITEHDRPTRISSFATDNRTVDQVEFNPNGDIVAFSANHSIRHALLQFWDVTEPKSPELVGSIFDEQDINSIEFTSDGNILILATGGHGSGRLEFWNVSDFRFPVKINSVTLPGDQDFIDVTFGSDKKVLATATTERIGEEESSAVQLWDVSDWNLPVVKTIFQRAQGVANLEFGLNDQILATVSSNQVELWDTSNRYQPVRAAVIPDDQGADSATFSPDGTRLGITGGLTGDIGHTGKIQVWDVRDIWSPHSELTVPSKEERPVTAIFGDDGSTLIAGAVSNVGGSVEIWNLRKQRILPRISLLPEGEALADVAFSPNGALLAAVVIKSGEIASELRLWDATDRSAPIAVVRLPGDRGGHTLKFGADSRTLAVQIVPSESVDGSTQLWDLTGLNTPAREIRLLREVEGDVATFSPDNRMIAVVADAGESSESALQLWSLDELDDPAPIATLHNEEKIDFARFGGKGRTIAVVSTDEQSVSVVRLWKLTDLEFPVAVAVPNIDSSHVDDVLLSPDGQLLVTVSAEGEPTEGYTVRLWRTQGQESPFLAHTFAQQFTAAAFSPDGQILVTTTGRWRGATPGKVQFWDLGNSRSPRNVATLDIDESADSVAYSPDGETVAVGAFGGLGGGSSLKLFDVSDQRNPTLIGDSADESDSLSAVVFSPDARLIETGGPLFSIESNSYRTAQIWDVEWATSIDGRLRSWSCVAAGGGLTTEEWSQLDIGFGYEKSC